MYRELLSLLFVSPVHGIIPALIAGGAALIGTMMQNSASAKQAKQAMEFQAGMSSTAHQREVQDLQKAGLNPILSGTGGMGASSPQGQMAPQQNVLGNVVASAQEARRSDIDYDRQKTALETERFNRDIAENDRIMSNNELYLSNARYNYRDRQAAAEIRSLEASAGERSSSARSAAVAADIDESERNAERMRRWTRPIGEAVSTGLSLTPIGRAGKGLRAGSRAIENFGRGASSARSLGRP